MQNQIQGERTVRDYIQRGHIDILPNMVKRKLKAGAYCRVSSDKDEQESSFERQVEYYTKFINEHSDEYEMVEIFADKGTSGLSMRRRKEFNRMVAMALNGEIDIIFVKSISRYGRSVIDILSTTRQLRDKGVIIKFEKEGIDSGDPKCDMMLSILSTLSEEESRSISTNVRWAKDKLFQQGIVRINFSALYGYRGGGKSEITVCPEEAEEVRGVFYKFIAGWTYAEISRDLGSRGCVTPMGNTKWDKTTVRGMLAQEKYMGDVLLKKTFKKDLMQLYPTKNTGQMPQKYVQNNHPAIIDRETFAAAQAEIERRQGLRSSGESGRGRYSGKFAFSNLIICGECGYRFRRHNYRNHAKPYPRIEPVWTCYNHLSKADSCKQLPIKEKYLEELFVNTLNELLADRQSILSQLEEIITESITETACDTDGQESIDNEIERLQAEMLELNRRRAKKELSGDEYKAQSESVTRRLDALFDERDKANEINGSAVLEKAKLELIQDFLLNEREQTAFDRETVIRLVDSVIVKSRTDITFVFKNGLQMKARTDEAATAATLHPMPLPNEVYGKPVK